jgi:hypothetical protein
MCVGENITRLETTEYTVVTAASGVHSIMRVKLAWLLRVGGARPPPFTTFTITSKVAVYAPAEWADTLTLFHLYQYMYSVLETPQSQKPRPVPLPQIIM